MYDPSQYLGDFSYVISPVTLSASAIIPICGANVNRVAIIVPNTSGNTMGLSIQSSFSQFTGMIEFSSGTTYTILWKDLGAIVTYPWYGLVISGTAAMTVTEVIYRPLED